MSDTDAPVTLHFGIAPNGELIPQEPDDDDGDSGPPVPPEAFVGDEGPQSAAFVLGEADMPKSADKAAPAVEPIAWPNVSDHVGWIGDGGAHRYPAVVCRRVGPTLEEHSRIGPEPVAILDLFVFGPEPYGGYHKNVHHVSRVNIREEDHWCFIGRDYL